MAGFADCTSVTPACPVEATTYGYYPALWVNALYCAIFGLLCIAQVILGLWSRIRGYSIAVACGCLLECIGYGGRLIMHNNPWTTPGFEMQIVCLIIGPSFTAAGVYLTLKHAVRHNGAEFSRLKPAMYPWIFVCCDVGSILLQAAGGGVAASAGKTNRKLLSAGNSIIIAGIAFQVATMIICGILTTDYIISLLQNRRRGGANLPAQERGVATKAHIFQTAVAFAYLTILIRCIYRLPEMAGGWGNPRMRNETEFLILDGLMILLASIALTVFHPALFFPFMRLGGKKDVKENRSPSSEISL